MSDRRISTTTKALIKARDFLSDEANWCPERPNAINPGHDIGPDGRTRLCAMRALAHAVTGRKDVMQVGRDLVDPLNILARACNGDIVDVNAKGHKAVMQLYDKAISMSIHRDQQT